MRVVAISQRVDPYPERNEIRDALDQQLTAFLLSAGYLPVPVPNGLHAGGFNDKNDYSALNLWLLSLKPEAFVLSGGNDIGQYKERDLTEDCLLNYAKINKSPVLGICHGMQVIANYEGAILHKVEGHVRTRHCISGEISGEVNSFHNTSIKLCPESFEVLAISEDGEIEAIRHRSLPWEGWMWHPEREIDFAVRDIRRIKNLFWRQSK